MKTTEQLIDDMASGLRPVAPARWGVAWITWLCASALAVALAIHVAGPIRATALQQLQEVPRFALEMGVGAAAAITLALLAFRSAIPGVPTRRPALLAAGLVALWLTSFLAGFAVPALEPSMLGKRDHCVVETVLYGLPPMLALIYWQRRMYALSPARASVLAALAAGILPALYMQVACMYAPAHILAYHVAPVVLLAILAPVFLRALRTVRVAGTSR